MAFKLVSAGGINVNPTIVEVMTSGSISIGDNVSPFLYGGGYANTDLLYVTRLGATATAYATPQNLFGISCDNVNSATGMCNVILINAAQIWEADTTAATSITHRYKANALAGHGYVGNQVRSISGTVSGYGVWFNLREVGATTDYKMLGRFNPPNNLGDI